MRKNFGAKPWTYPQPVFILAAYGEDGTPNAMNAAWGGISDDKELSMCISAGHKTTANILARKAFTVSMATAEQAVACDYVGIESGNQAHHQVGICGCSPHRRASHGSGMPPGELRPGILPPGG